jgi:ankyrin repeat protein
VKLLLDKDGIEFDKAGYRGDTPLKSAAGGGHTEIVKLLLEKDGIEVDKTDKNGSTPLSSAAETGNAETVKLLIECYAYHTSYIHVRAVAESRSFGRPQ